MVSSRYWSVAATLLYAYLEHEQERQHEQHRPHPDADVDQPHEYAAEAYRGERQPEPLQRAGQVRPGREVALL